MILSLALVVGLLVLFSVFYLSVDFTATVVVLVFFIPHIKLVYLAFSLSSLNCKNVSTEPIQYLIQGQRT